ncbi:MAG: hypothetical protein K8R60_05360 [Burkholderiales bacterium]|nr:hypothetical protein [Burkholderiales bacterium]
MAVSSLAQAQLVEIDWGAQQRFARELRVEPGKFVEACGKLQRGAAVQWQFEASAPTDFNVHFHEGKEVRFPAQQQGTAKSQGRLDVSLDQDYCWMWSNKGTTALTLSVDLRKIR